MGIESDTNSIATTFAIVQSIALVTMLVGVWAWALFMFKALREVLVAHRELVASMVSLKAHELSAPMFSLPPGTARRADRLDVDAQNQQEILG